MRIKPLILVVFLLAFVVSFYPLAKDTVCIDAVYFSCGSDSSANGDTLYIPYVGTHDVRIFINFSNDSPIYCINVPLMDQCYDPLSSAFIDTIKYPHDSFYVWSRIENWPLKMFRVNYSTHQVFLGASALLDPPVESGDGLFATMIYTVNDTGRICLDTLTWNYADLEFCIEDGYALCPTFFADTFIIAARQLCGDINGNENVEVSDVVLFVNYLFKGGDPPECPPFPYNSCADANGDGEVTIPDAVYLINYLFKSGPDPICS